MIQKLEKCRQSAAITKINAFLRTPGYIILMAALAAMGGVFALDLWAYCAFILVASYICLLGDDLLPLMPVAIFCYITPSRDNNPGKNPESIFYPEHGGMFLLALAAVLLVCLILRLATDKEIGRKAFFTAPRKLLPGMLLLSGAYLLSGIGLSNYAEIAGQNLLFALLQVAAVVALYYLFAGMVKWENAPKNYLAWLGMCTGFVVLAQLLGLYFSGTAFAPGTMVIDRENISTGWGMHNNIGCLMATSIPFCFYLACKEKRGWVYNLLAILLMIGVILSCSRSSMLLGGIGFAIGAGILLVRYDKGRKNLLIYGICAVTLAGVVVIFREKIFDLFGTFLSRDLTAVSSRDKLIINGFKQFLTQPVFGGSFFPQGEYVPWDFSTQEAFSSFFPPRWHNTIIQVLASAGVVGIAAYGFHRFQTAKLLLTNRSSEKTFIGIYMLVLLGASLLDCHFFNVGPVMLYSIALAFAEKIELSKV